MEGNGNRGRGGRGRGGYKGSKPLNPQREGFTFTPAKQSDDTESHGGGGGRGGSGRGGRGGGRGEHSVVPKVNGPGHIGKKSTISCSSLKLDLPRPVSSQTNMEFLLSILTMSELFRMQRTSEQIPDLLRMVEAEIRKRLEKDYETVSCPTDRFEHWVFFEHWILLSYALNKPEDGWNKERDFYIISRALYNAVAEKEYDVLRKMFAQCKISGIDMLEFYNDIFVRLNRLGDSSLYRYIDEGSFKLLIDCALECAIECKPDVTKPFIPAVCLSLSHVRGDLINYGDKTRDKYANIILQYCLNSYQSGHSLFAVKYLLPMIDMTPEVLKTIVNEYRWGLKCINIKEIEEIRFLLLDEAKRIYDFILSLHGDKMSASSILNGTEEQIIPNELLAIIGYSPLMLTA